MVHGSSMLIMPASTLVHTSAAHTTMCRLSQPGTLIVAFRCGQPYRATAPKLWNSLEAWGRGLPQA